MSEEELNRRRFLKRIGTTALGLPAAVVVGKIGEAELVASPGEYGDFLVRRLPKGQPPYRIDDAFMSASWTVAQSLGSGAGAIGGSNGGLYSWQPLGGSPMDEMPVWDGSDWTAEEVSEIVTRPLFSTVHPYPESRSWMRSGSTLTDSPSTSAIPSVFTPQYVSTTSKRPPSSRTEPW